MNHFLYFMKSNAKAPAGDGDTKSWFLYYKWNIEGESWVPKEAPFYEAEPGDMLWFVIDGTLLGGVPILRIENPSLPHQNQDVWYDAGKILESPEGGLREGEQVDYLLVQGAARLKQEVGDRWLAAARSRS